MLAGTDARDADGDFSSSWIIAQASQDTNAWRLRRTTHFSVVREQPNSLDLILGLLAMLG
jgi:hypothetical protein